MAEAPKLPNLVQRFFTQHLREHKNAARVPSAPTATRSGCSSASCRNKPAARQPISGFPIWTHPPFSPSSTISNPNGKTMHVREICD